MLSDAVTPLVSDDLITIITRSFICFSSLILVFSISFFERAVQLKYIRDNPEKSFFDKDLVDFTKSQENFISSDIRLEKFKGIFGCIISLLGVYLVITLVKSVTAEYAAFVFASYAVVALTIRALFLSIRCQLQKQRFKQAGIEQDQAKAAKELIDFNNKYLSRTVSITVAGLLISGYLLYHVNPVF